MKKFLLLTVFAFGASGFGFVHNAVGVEERVASTEIVPYGPHEMTDGEQAALNRLKNIFKQRSSQKIKKPLQDQVHRYMGNKSFSPAFKGWLQEVLNAVDANNQEQVQTLLEKGVEASAASSLPLEDAKAPKAWAKHMASVQQSLGVLKAALAQLEKNAASYDDSGEATKDQNVMNQVRLSLSKSIISIEDSLGSLGRFGTNQSVQKYLDDFSKGLQGQVRMAFLRDGKRVAITVAQIDKAKLILNEETIEAVRKNLETLNQFLLQHRKFLGKMRALKASPDDLKATYTLAPTELPSTVSTDEPFKPSVDGSRFDGKKDRDLVKMVGTLQSLITPLMTDLTKIIGNNNPQGDLMKKASFLVKKVQNSDEMKETSLNLGKMLYLQKQDDVKKILVQLEAYRQELDHMLGVLKTAQEKAAGKDQASADRQLIDAFFTELKKALGIMVRHGDVQKLTDLFNQWMPKPKDMLPILSEKNPKVKGQKLAQVREWLETLQTVK